jgi:hypothetical protein
MLKRNDGAGVRAREGDESGFWEPFLARKAKVFAGWPVCRDTPASRLKNFPKRSAVAILFT